MTLEQFIAAAKSDIDKFHQSWIEGMAAGSDMYPAEMEEGDWFEQLLCYLTSSVDGRG